MSRFDTRIEIYICLRVSKFKNLMEKGHIFRANGYSTERKYTQHNTYSHRPIDLTF